MLSNIKVSPSPHVSKAYSTQRVMLDVIIGLTPAMVMAVVYFRMPALKLLAACIITCMLTEALCNVLMKRPNTLGDLSAVVTGIILALSLSAAVPVWAAVIGSVFAIAVSKMAFGGLGCNIFNPAMAARTFMTLSFGTLMTTWTVPATIDSSMPKISAAGTQAVTQATPLAWTKEALKDKIEPQTVEENLFIASIQGQTGGCLGETSAIALLLGGAYLLIRKTITWHIPVAVLAAAFAYAAVAWLINKDDFVNPLMHLVTGGMLLCAFFIATDPVTAPLTSKGMLIFGAGLGLLIMLIRTLGEYPEGVMYAVLIMNSVTPLIDRFCKLTPYGGLVNAKK